MRQLQVSHTKSSFPSQLLAGNQTTLPTLDNVHNAYPIPSLNPPPTSQVEPTGPDSSTKLERQKRNAALAKEYRTHTMAVRKREKERLSSLGPGNRMLSRGSEDKQSATCTQSALRAKSLTSLCQQSAPQAAHTTPILLLLLRLHTPATSEKTPLQRRRLRLSRVSRGANASRSRCAAILSARNKVRIRHCSGRDSWA